MRSLYLDYQADARRPVIGIILLVAGVLAAGAVLAEYRSMRENLSAWETRVAEVRARAKRNSPAAGRPAREHDATEQEIRTARLALQRLSSRWIELFAALESARADGVALLSIEPDPTKGVVRLMAEARSAEHMLAYVERLQAADTLANVSLASHQIKPGDPQKPLRFAVLASWTSQP